MKNVFKLTLISAFGLLLTSCGAPRTAPEAMAENEFRNQVYREIANDQSKFMEFMQVVHNNDEAEKWLLKDHFDMMENGQMKKVMEKNPEMKEKMKKMMHEKMENDPEMQKKMQDKMKSKMMADPEMKKAMMEKMHADMKANPEMAEKMMDHMIQFLHENPALMEKMKAKMKAHQEEMKAGKKKGDHKH
jgi:hypothetical protein